MAFTHKKELQQRNRLGTVSRKVVLGAGCLNQFYSRKTSPVLLVHFQITNICSVSIVALYLISETSKWNNINITLLEKQSKGLNGHLKPEQKKTRKRTSVWNKPSFSITKTYLYNFDPLTPHFYIVKLGFTGAYIIFLILLENIDCGYSLELGLRFDQIYEKFQSFLSENFEFLEWIFLYIWIGMFS